ncbi:MAG: hypothetical protein ACLUKN_06015 [Bacilli bacterium]
MAFEHFQFSPQKWRARKQSGDETKKYLFGLSDGNFIECVLLKAPSEDGGIRKTLCLSTQVGCACACKFCASALRGFVRNLTAEEIISQALPFVEETIDNGKRIRRFEFENIVVMGMGEPLINYINLMSALKVFNSAEKFAFGARRITVSTCGIADRLEKPPKTDSLPPCHKPARSHRRSARENHADKFRFPLARLLGAAENSQKAAEE